MEKTISYNEKKEEFIDTVDVLIRKYESGLEKHWNWILLALSHIVSIFILILPPLILYSAGTLTVATSNMFNGIVRVLSANSSPEYLIIASAVILVMLSIVAIVVLIEYRLSMFISKKLSLWFGNKIQLEEFNRGQDRLEELYSARLFPKGKKIWISDEKGIEFKVLAEDK